MQAIYISTVFGEYMGDWKKSVENNSAWKYIGGGFRSERHGFTLFMRFSEALKVTMYECSVSSPSSHRVADLEQFNFEQAWKVMWGSRNISPDHITILTRENYMDFLLNSNSVWKKEQERGNCIIHHPTQSTFESDEEGTFNNLSVDQPGSVQVYLRKLTAMGFPINQKFLSNVG
ncbi:hypothetical protein [Alkalihalobacillus sp. BA299]|uniref:hypothetical protein n=1 Tax=Alkalihalobacillus sp. BA299 TaxID=2815938 RepID=UPI001ADA4ABA|nr:hypothetical protein [Alkalihalobacillus sp. BA299]